MFLQVFTSKKISPILVPLILLVLSFALYLNSLGGEFLIDDFFFVDRPYFNTVSQLPRLWLQPLLPWHKEAGLYRPMLSTSMAVQLILFGKNTFPFHLFNAALNSLNVILVYMLTLKLFQKKQLAFFTALIFLVLPIHTEAVAYIKARDELLAAFFSLASWLVFTKAIDRQKISWPKICFSVLLIFPAMLSKEFAVVTWGLYILVALIQKKISFKNSVIVGFIFLLPFCIYLGMRYAALDKYFFGDDINFISNPLKYEKNLAPKIWTPYKIAYIYLSQTFVPLNLSSSYHYPQVPLVSNPLTSPETMFGLIFIITLAVLVLFPKSFRHPVGLGSFIFLYLYLPFSQIIVRGGDMVGERWMYLPSLGLALILAWTLNSLKKVGLFILILLLVFYSFLTIKRNLTWTDPETLYLAAIKSAPNGAKLYASAGYLYLEKGEFQKAKTYGEKSLALYDRYAPTYDLLGGIAYNLGDYDQALIYLKKALETDAEFYNVYQNLARVYYIKGRYQNSLALMDRFVQLYPIELKIQDKIFYALVLAKNGLFQDSLLAAKKYLSTDLKYPEVRFILAVDYYHLGDHAEASKYFTWRKDATVKDLLKEVTDFPVPATQSAHKN